MSARILVVDSEPSICLMLHAFLKRNGYTALVAANQEQALRLCRSESVDLMLVDAGWPPPGGHDLVRAVALEYPNIPVVLMANGVAECEACPHSGCRSVRKPFHFSSMLATIANLLSAPAPE